MSRTDKVNSLMEQELGRAMSKELETKGYLVTITFAKCSPDFKEAQIGVSIIPSNLTGTALRELKKKSGIIAAELKKRTKWRRMPKLKWEVDRSAKRAQEINKTIDKISNKEI